MSLISAEILAKAEEQIDKHTFFLCKRFLNIHNKIPPPLYYLYPLTSKQRKISNKLWLDFYTTAMFEAWQLYMNKYEEETLNE